MPGADIQLAPLGDGQVRTDFGGEIIANSMQDPDILFVPGGGSEVFEALQDDLFLDHIARIGA